MHLACEHDRKMRRSGSSSFRPGSMADVLGSSSTIQLRRSPSASNWNLFRSDDSPEPPTEPHKTYRIAELQPVTTYGSFEDHREKDEEKALPSEEPSGTKPEAGTPPESKTKRRVKVGILFCFFFSLIMLWLLAQQIDPEVAGHVRKKLMVDFVVLANITPYKASSRSGR